MIENAVSSGDTVLIENVEESVDPVLEPLLGRNTIKKGRYEKCFVVAYRYYYLMIFLKDTSKLVTRKWSSD